MKNFKTILGISAVSLLFATSAFAAAGEDYALGGSYGTLTEDKDDSDYYSYSNWTSNDTGSSYSPTASLTYDNLTIGAGSSFTYSTTTKVLTLDSLNLYGNEDSLATFTQGANSTEINVSGDVIFNYGAYTQSAVNTFTVDGDFTVSNSSFTLKAGGFSTKNFNVTNSTITYGYGTGSNTKFTVSDTLTLGEGAKFYFGTDASSTKATGGVYGYLYLNNLVMTSDSVFNANYGDVNSGTYSYVLTFVEGFSISISDTATFSATATTFSGNGSISLVVDGLSDSTATIEGSINLGTVTLSDSILSLYLDVSNIDLSTVAEAETAFDLSDFITISNAGDLTDDNFEVFLTDADGNLDANYSASFDSTDATITFVVGGAAVPEPSTYAMILGAFALGFAYYRRRK